VRVEVAAETAPISAQAVLDAVHRVRPCRLVLLEAGPRLMSVLFAERLLDELFLTVAPQVAGRDGVLARPGFVAGTRFAPDHSIWGTLVGLKRGGDHLFLRYAFSTRQTAGEMTHEEQES
jgi:riboflavin biosynthesis pyrimidine reductase